jgi:hypothetical protein
MEGVTPVDQETKKTAPFIKAASIKVGAEGIREKNYDIQKILIEGETTTGIGKFFIGSQISTGLTMTFGPDVIPETVDVSYLENGRRRQPKEDFEGLKMQYGYGAQLSIKDVKLTIGGGYFDYTAETPRKQIGLDAKAININGYQIILKGDTGCRILNNDNDNFEVAGPRLGLGAIHQKQSWDYRVGYTGYTFCQNGEIISDELNAYYSLTPRLILKTGLIRKETDQQIFFQYSGLPPLFPNKNCSAEQYTLKPGLQVNDFLGLKSIEAGPIIQAGKTISSFLAIPIETGPQSLGAYLELATKGGYKFSLSIAQTKASGTDGYFSPNDLAEQTDITQVTASAFFKKVSVTGGYTHLKKGATFIKPTPVDFLLSRFPLGGSRTTAWEDDAFSLSVTYQLNKNLAVTITGEYADANYNQYGNHHFFPDKRLIGGFLTLNF